ncbi:nucleoside hydrolase [Yoonia sp. SS1-5]|uniref:Nucleoside hydrolase n=2 Tax=Yoonia rhodophyticola TaxID=3137370 RepID=A0ABZ3JBC8_9RHOB
MKLIIDTDPGIDDAMAYFYAHAHPDIDLVALTTVFGNVTTDDATRNALWLTQMSKARTEVYQGSDKPLQIVPNRPSDHVHGPHGFGDVQTDMTEPPEPAGDAVDFLLRMARENPGVFTICAIGPLTNIAKAVTADPDFIGNLKRLVIMGGSLDAGGNITPHAEANFWNDPHAADIVLNAPGGGEVVVVGLDVTTKIAFVPQDFADLANAAPETGAFLQQIGDFYMRFYQTVSGKLHCYLHDPAAVVACDTPAHFSVKDVRLGVVTSGEAVGQMVRRSDGEGRLCKVCIDVDAQAVVDQFKQYTALNP